MKTVTSRAHKSGFTLIELLVVMAIIGIVGGTTLITYDIFGTGSSQEFQEILSFLRVQHGRTLRTGSSVTVILHGESDRLEIIDNEETIDELTFNRWTLQNPSGTIRLRLSPWNYEPITLTLRNNQGEQRSIQTDWTLGFVEVN